jgi:hypothetical protein
MGVVSDCWAWCSCYLYAGYGYMTVNQSITFLDEETGAIMNTVESTWRQPKATKLS